MTMNSRLRSLKWRLGRKLYMSARGEPNNNLPASSGEVYVQKSVISGAKDTSCLTVFDIGANRGQWSLQFASILPDSRRVSDAIAHHVFEPTPKSRELTQQRLKDIGHLDFVSLHDVALSDEVGEAKFAIWNDTAGTNTLRFDERQAQDAKYIITVPLQTLDSFANANGVDHIHLAKVDTEGNDARVISGAKSLLAAEAIDVMQFEYNHRWIDARAYLKDAFSAIIGTPYMLCRVMPNSLEFFEAWHPELERFFEANYVLVHPRAAAWFNITKGRIGASNVYEAAK